jgi:RNA polymerase sigma factor (sigma-70 family)
VSFIARRNGLPAGERDDFASLVKLKLIENDYEILRRFEGRSSLRTYLVVVVQRLFLDERTRRWGKWRPSARARRLGPAAVRLETLVVRDGKSPAQAFAESGVVPAELKAFAESLERRSPRVFVGEEALAGAAADGEPPGERLERREAEPELRRAAALLRRAIGELAPADRLLLRLRFEDGFSIVEIARLRREEARPLYRRIEKLLKKLRATVEALGLDGRGLADRLSRFSDFEEPLWAPRATGNLDAGPSFQVGGGREHETDVSGETAP